MDASFVLQWSRLDVVVPTVPSSAQLLERAAGPLGSLAEELGRASIMNAAGPPRLEDRAGVAARVGFAIADDVLELSAAALLSVRGDDLVDLVEAHPWAGVLPPLFADLADRFAASLGESPDGRWLVESFAVGVATAVIAAALADPSTNRASEA